MPQRRTKEQAAYLVDYQLSASESYVPTDNLRSLKIALKKQM